MAWGGTGTTRIDYNDKITYLVSGKSDPHFATATSSIQIQSGEGANKPGQLRAVAHQPVHLPHDPQRGVGSDDVQ